MIALLLVLLAPGHALAAAGKQLSPEPESPGSYRIAAPPTETPEPWHVTPEMRAWLHREVNRVGTADQRMRRILRALERKGLTYDDTATGTASDVFRTERFNCLGLAHIVVGLGRELGVPAYYVEAVNPDIYGQRGDLVLAASHVVAGWGPPAGIKMVEYGVQQGESRTRPVGRIEDHSAAGLHYANRGAEMLVAGQPQLAVDWLHEALRYDPTSTAAWVNLGVASRRLGDHQRAEESYLQALAIDPTNRSAMRNLAALEKLSGNTIGAHTMLQKLAKVRHRNPFTYVALGELHLRNGQLGDAAPFFRRATRLGRHSAGVLAARGSWHLALGEVEAAERWLARAMAVDPHDDRVERLSDALSAHLD